MAPAFPPFSDDARRQKGIETSSGYCPTEVTPLALASGLALTQSSVGSASPLQASRRRIVAAGDTERRRLERDLHDGAQQRLVALAMQLRLIQADIRRDPRWQSRW